MKITVNVTQANLDKGGNRCNCCPIYHALMDIPQITEAQVFSNWIGFRYNDKWFARDLPEVARDFIEHWDNQNTLDEFSPFSFDVVIYED